MAWLEQGSYEKINYSLRPAKNIERKMMFEIFNRLSVINHMSDYRYIGFGSAYFSDFILAHKTFGISDLISIEIDDEEVNDRFRFNKPYTCIDLKFGYSKEILPTLKLSEKKSILWLDYDKSLNLDMFEDVATFFREACPGSVFAITVNVEPYRIPPAKKDVSEKDYRREKLEKAVGSKRIPHEYLDINLGNKENPQAIITILNNEISNILNVRNGSKSTGNKFLYKQLLNFLYKDGALMLTLGGILYSESQNSEIERMAFHNLDYVRESNESLLINVPNLTYKEIRSLDNLLPHRIDIDSGEIDRSDSNFVNIPVLKPIDIINYAKVYRFFPNFAESTQ